MDDIILKFPNSKRKLTQEEERLVRRFANIIYNANNNSNPFVTSEQKVIFIEEQLKSLIRKMYQLDEDRQ